MKKAFLKYCIDGAMVIYFNTVHFWRDKICISFIFPRDIIPF